MRPLPLLATFAALALPGAALAGSCDAALAAAKKLDAVPYRLHSVTVAAGDQAGSEPEVADMIATKDKLYFQLDGDWQSVPRDMSGLGEIGNDLEAGDVTCRQLADAELNGVPTAVYAIDDAAQPDITSQTIWVAKASGLMLRVEQSLDEGVGDDGKSKITMDFSFDDVTPPPRVE